MLSAISRFGIRVAPGIDRVVEDCRTRGQLVQGPAIAEFEAALASRLGGMHTVATSYGRSAFYFILRALDLPTGSEIIVPALTFWPIPELARVAGFTLRFADVDPYTFCLDPGAFEAAITERTRAVVPTHLFGLPCDMAAILSIARRHNLVVIEDCAHALGAACEGRPVGALGDAAFFSFQSLKPLSAHGGGLAVVRDRAVAARVRAQVDALPWPDEKGVSKKFLLGKLERAFTHPRGFTFSMFPVLWASSFANARPDVLLW
jgi:dTDP-4-amino-4,6-dideoxygalactose transaminase